MGEKLPPTQISYLVFRLLIAIQINGIYISYVITVTVLYNRSTWNMNMKPASHTFWLYIQCTCIYQQVYHKTRVNDHLYVALGVWLRGGRVTLFNANVNNISTTLYIMEVSFRLMEEIGHSTGSLPLILSTN